nr:DUF2135 domain-containing protein [Paraburkholderia phytofirmans]
MFFPHYWGNFDSTGYNFDAAAHERNAVAATLTLVFNENTPNERCETMVMRAARDRRPAAREKRATLTEG